MKINSSHINLGATREYFQREETIVEQEVRFATLMDQRLEHLTPQAGFVPGLQGQGSGLFSTTQVNGLSAVELSQSFIAELEKLRQILGAIMDRLNTTGFNGCCLGTSGFGKIGLFALDLPAPRMVEYEMVERYQYSYQEEENTDFFADGLVTTEDGRSIDFSFQMNLERSYFHMDRFERKEKGYVMIDPLVINLDSTLPQISATRIDFDLDVDGTLDEIAVPQPGTAFLSLDRNKDGEINDGSELFGPATGDGFKELSMYDEDRNMWIDENDSIFDELTLWEGDDTGQMQLTRIKDAGIGAIYLAGVPSQFDLKDEDNNLRARIKKSSIALNEDGSVSSVQEMDWTV